MSENCEIFYNEENIQKLVDVNEIKSESKQPVIAAIEQCLPKPAKILTRDKWYQSYSLPDSYIKDRGVRPPPKYQVGEHVSSIEAVNDPKLQTDFRPRVFDNITKTWTLLDSGSCVSCIPKDPEDKIDPSFKLRAVNGQSIPTFGSKIVQIRIGRKQYEIEAIKTEIPQTILGWDLFRKYNLGFEWESDELFLTDKKAGIKSLLKFVKIDSGITKRIESLDHYEEPVFSGENIEQILFEKMCMDALDEVTNADETAANHVNSMTIHPDQPSPIAEDIPLGDNPEKDECYQENLKALNKLKGPFADLIREYSDILKANFKKEPTGDIYH